MIELLALFLAVLSDQERSDLLTRAEIRAEIYKLSEALELAFEHVSCEDLRCLDREGFESAEKRGRKIWSLTEKLLSREGLNTSDPVLFVDFLELPADLRGAGRGRSVVEGLEAGALRHGAKASVLYSAQISDGPSVVFWKKMGYRALFSYRDAWGIPAAVMYKCLDAPALPGGER